MSGYPASYRSAAARYPRPAPQGGFQNPEALRRAASKSSWPKAIDRLTAEEVRMISEAIAERTAQQRKAAAIKVAVRLAARTGLNLVKWGTRISIAIDLAAIAEWAIEDVADYVSGFVPVEIPTYGDPENPANWEFPGWVYNEGPPVPDPLAGGAHIVLGEKLPHYDRSLGWDYDLPDQIENGEVPLFPYGEEVVGPGPAPNDYIDKVVEATIVHEVYPTFDQVSAWLHGSYIRPRVGVGPAEYIGPAGAPRPGLVPVTRVMPRSRPDRRPRIRFRPTRDPSRHPMDEAGPQRETTPDKSGLPLGEPVGRGNPAPQAGPNIRPSARNRPARRREKERKMRMRAGWYRAVVGAISGITETLDGVNALWEALPPSRRTGYYAIHVSPRSLVQRNGRTWYRDKKGKLHAIQADDGGLIGRHGPVKGTGGAVVWVKRFQAKPQQIADDLYRYSDQIDLNKAAKNYLENQIEDYVFGKSGQAAGKAAQKAQPHGKLPFGFQVGPAL